MAVLAALVATNAALLILLRTGGPLIGIAFYVAILVVVWRGHPRDYRVAMVGGLAGVAVHAAELATMGGSAYSVLLALNLVLPAVLAPVAWFAARPAQS